MTVTNKKKECFVSKVKKNKPNKNPNKQTTKNQPKSPNGYLCTANWASLHCKEDWKLFLFFPSRYKGCPGQHVLGCRSIPSSRPAGTAAPWQSHLKWRSLMALNGEKYPWKASKQGLPPCSPCLHWPRKASPGKSIPREGHSSGKSIPREKGDAAKQIHIAGSLEETSSVLSGKIFPSRQKAEGKDGKEGRKVAFWQAPPDLPKESAQHGWLAAPRKAKRKKKALPQPGAEMSKTFWGKVDNTKGGVNTGTAHGTGSKTPRQSPNSAVGWIWDHSSSVVRWKKTPNHNIPRYTVLSRRGILGHAKDSPCHWSFLGF